MVHTLQNGLCSGGSMSLRDVEDDFDDEESNEAEALKIEAAPTRIPGIHLIVPLPTSEPQPVARLQRPSAAQACNSQALDQIFTAITSMQRSIATLAATKTSPLRLPSPHELPPQRPAGSNYITSLD